MLGKLPMSVERIATDAQNLGIELFKSLQIALKSLEYTLSDRGEISKIKRQDGNFFLQHFGQVDFTAV